MEMSASQSLAAARLNESREVIKKKKISFFGAILLIISSCIGSGIFFKSARVLEYNSASFILSIVSWVVSAIAVICMAIALIEVASKDKDNLSLIGWCKKFNNPFIYKCCLNYMVYVYMPLVYLYLPYYIIVSIQMALRGFGLGFSFGTANDWAIWMFIGICFSTWFIFTSGINTKMADIQNKIITSLTFIPLLPIVIIGLVMVGMNGTQIKILPETNTDPSDLWQVWPGFGTVLSMSAIFFAFDGFYFASGIQKEMKEPQKTPKAIIIGLVVVTVIYLTIAIVMTLAGSTEGFYKYNEFLSEHNLGWIFGLLNLLITTGVLGTLNGFTVWSTRLIQDLILERQLPFSDKLIHKVEEHKPIVGAVYVYVLSMVFVIIFSTIGGLTYIPDGYLDKSTGQSISDSANFNSSAKLFTFTDLMANWASIFAFTFIMFAICGCYKNRKTNRVEVVQNKHFKWAAIASVIMIGLPLILTLLEPFVNLGLLLSHKNYSTNNLISRIMLIVVLFMFLGASIIPSLIPHSKKLNIKN